jgi:hypothetical protein
MLLNLIGPIPIRTGFTDLIIAGLIFISVYWRKVFLLAIIRPAPGYLQPWRMSISITGNSGKNRSPTFL